MHGCTTPLRTSSALASAAARAPPIVTLRSHADGERREPQPSDGAAQKKQSRRRVPLRPAQLVGVRRRRAPRPWAGGRPKKGGDELGRARQVARRRARAAELAQRPLDDLGVLAVYPVEPPVVDDVARRLVEPSLRRRRAAQVPVPGERIRRVLTSVGPHH